MKIRIKFIDLIKMLFGKRILIINNLDNRVFEVKKGKDNYICK